jgi:hypothetical protein
MSVKELEQRVLALERQVQQLQKARESSPTNHGHDWEATVAKFKNDEHILAVLSEAMKSREQERKAVRKGRSSRRKNP